MLSQFWYQEFQFLHFRHLFESVFGFHHGNRILHCHQESLKYFFLGVLGHAFGLNVSDGNFFPDPQEPR